MTRIKTLEIGTPQGLAGVLAKDSRFVFNYETGVGASREISLGMPARAESYGSSTLHPVFAMNRPEGYLYNVIVQRMAKFEALDDMRLLSILGGNQIGRLSYALPGTEAKKHIHQIGREQLLRERQPGLFEFLVDTYFDSGISGVQPKVMVPDADVEPREKGVAVLNDLIVKASGQDFPFLAQNEFLCMEVARLAGMHVPRFALSDDGELFIMDRFDLDGERRLGFEEMSVLMNKTPDPAGNYKYTESYEAIGRVINAYCRGDEAVRSRQRFFEYVALSVMVRNGDAHLKNFGLLYNHPGGDSPTLSPVYDVVTTTAYTYPDSKTGRPRTDSTLAIKLSGSKNYPIGPALEAFGRDECGVTKPAQAIARIADAMTTVLDLHRDRIDPSLLKTMRAQWEEGRRSMGQAVVFQPRGDDDEDPGGQEKIALSKPA